MQAVRLANFASATLLRRHYVAAPADLVGVPLIQSTVSVVQWAEWFSAQGVREAPEHFSLRFDRAQLALDTAVQGPGVALESTTIAGPHIPEGRLQPLVDMDRALTIQGHFLVFPARHAKRPEVEIFVQRLCEQTG